MTNPIFTKENWLRALTFATVIVCVFSSKAAVPLLLLFGLSLVWCVGLGSLRLSLLPRAASIGLAALVLWSLVGAVWSAAPVTVLKTNWPLPLLIAAGLVTVGLAARLEKTHSDAITSALMAGMVVALCLVVLEAATYNWIGRQLRGLEWPDIINFETGGESLTGLIKAPIAILCLLIWPVMARWMAAGNKLIPLALYVALIASAAWFDATTAMLVLVAGGVLVALGRWNLRVITRLFAAAALILIVAMPLLVRPITSTGFLMAADSGKTSIPIPVSGISRLHIWQFVSEKVSERPWTGWGLKSSRYVEGADQKYTVIRQDAQGREAILYKDFNLPLHPHNQALQIWLELGLIGALIAGLTAFAVIWRGAERAGSLGLGLIAGILIFDLLSFGAWQNWWIAAQFLAISYLVNVKRKPS
ncbi:MAG: O-antigen ligase family protein [Rhodospirillaceae bacterium]